MFVDWKRRHQAIKLKRFQMLYFWWPLRIRNNPAHQNDEKREADVWIIIGNNVIDHFYAGWMSQVRWYNHGLHAA